MYKISSGKVGIKPAQTLESAYSSQTAERRQEHLCQTAIATRDFPRYKESPNIRNEQTGVFERRVGSPCVGMEMRKG